MIVILYNSLIVAGLSAGLAVFIIIVDSIVNNYGEVNIDINKGMKTYKVKGGTPLLFTLAEKKIFIPSACGGKGTCGACKTKVLSDVGPILPTEKPLLSAEEQKENVRLSCQIKVKANIEIEIPEELFYVKQYDSEVLSIINVTHDIKEIKFKLLEPNSIEYKAGQYVQFEAPGYEKIKEPTQRAYSMSSNPAEKNVVELIIRLVPGGIVTSYVFNYLKEKKKVKLIGPFGEFFVRETEADLICVAGGSGMAPIKSIIHDMLYNKNSKRNIWYFFGARALQDLFYVNEFHEIEKKFPNFHFIPALSEPLPEDNWKGETGLITNILDKYLKNRVDQKTDKEGYLCGSPGMINACLKVMTDNKIPEEKIYFDKFA